MNPSWTFAAEEFNGQLCRLNNHRYYGLATKSSIMLMINTKRAIVIEKAEIEFYKRALKLQTIYVPFVVQLVDSDYYVELLY